MSPANKREKFTRPTCWSCGKKGHLRRNCLFKNTATYRNNSVVPSPAALNATVHQPMIVNGYIDRKPLQMLVDTGSAVTLLREDCWKEAVARRVYHIETALSDP